MFKMSQDFIPPYFCKVKWQLTYEAEYMKSYSYFYSIILFEMIAH